MTAHIETATYVSDLNPAYPLGSDEANSLDSHHRLTKAVLKATLPNANGAINPSVAEFNTLVGVTSPIQTQLDAKAPSASPSLTGTPTVPTAAAGTGTTQAASCAFVQAAIAAVNANGTFTLSIDSSASVSPSAGEHKVCTNASTVTVTMPAGPAAGNRVKVSFTNTLYSNVIDPGAEKIRAAAGTRTVNAKGATIEFTYINSSTGWVY